MLLEMSYEYGDDYEGMWFECGTIGGNKGYENFSLCSQETAKLYKAMKLYYEAHPEALKED